MIEIFIKGKADDHFPTRVAVILPFAHAIHDITESGELTIFPLTMHGRGSDGEIEEVSPMILTSEGRLEREEIRRMAKVSVDMSLRLIGETMKILRGKSKPPKESANWITAVIGLGLRIVKEAMVDYYTGKAHYPVSLIYFHSDVGQKERFMFTPKDNYDEYLLESSKFISETITDDKFGDVKSLGVHFKPDRGHDEFITIDDSLVDDPLWKFVREKLNIFHRRKSIMLKKAESIEIDA